MPKLKLQDPVRPADVPIRDVRQELRDTIDGLVSSYKEADGVVRDPDAVYAIACNQRALELLPKR